MSRQDKATTERHTKLLRELLKKPDNKVCADCKRNDPRWASWNLGVFLCIRCSGIHRSMGTHISKVKSVDLDTWTPPQMEIIQRWGNRLANKYWEAHLKAGHVPPDHKMDSFIRSKYETRRWALEGPVPEDPTVLDTDAPAPAAAPAQPPAPVQTQAPAHTSAPVQRHQLLSATHQQQPQRLQPPNQQQQQPAPAAAAQPAPAPAQDGIFSLDFHSPTPPAQSPTTAARNPKQDIMSLFASSTPPPQPAAQAAAWGQPQQQQQPVPQQSMVGMNGTGMWGVSSGWGGPAQQQQQAQQNVWGDFTSGSAQPVQPQMPYGAQPQMGFGAQPQAGFGAQPFGGQPQMGFGAAQPQQQPQQPSLFGTADIWGSSGSNTAAAPAAGNAGGQKDAFDDIWGGFK